MALTASEHGATYRVVRARKERACDDRRANYPTICRRVVRRGDPYVRAVMFPNHDAYSYIDPETRRPLNRPIVTILCFECASAYDTSGLLVIEAERIERQAASR